MYFKGFFVFKYLHVLIKGDSEINDAYQYYFLRPAANRGPL